MSKKGQHTTSDYIPWETAMERTSSIHKEKPVLAGILATGFTTGLRISDILAIKTKEFVGPTIKVLEGKTKKPRVIALNPWLIDFIDVCGLRSRPGYLFSSCDERSDRPMTVQHVTREMKKVFADIKGLNISTHSMRKTFGRRVMEQNNYSAHGLILLMDAFNHSSADITKVYLGLRQEEVNQIYLNIV